MAGAATATSFQRRTRRATTEASRSATCSERGRGAKGAEGLPLAPFGPTSRKVLPELLSWTQYRFFATAIGADEGTDLPTGGGHHEDFARLWSCWHHGAARRMLGRLDRPRQRPADPSDAGRGRRARVPGHEAGAGISRACVSG